MKGFKKILLLSLTLSLVVGSLYSTGWAADISGRMIPSRRDGAPWIYSLPGP